MPSPSSSLATLRPDLGGSLEEFDLAMDRQGFIGLQVFPVLEVGKQTGTFGKIPIEQLLQNRETKRAPGSGYARGKWTFTSASYACEEHGAEEPVDDRESRMYADYFSAELISAQRARDIVLRNAEKRIADMVFNSTTFASQTTPVSAEWDDFDAAIPIDNVETAAQAVWARTGLWPNALIINRHVFRNLRQCEQVIDRIAGAGAGMPTRAQDINVEHLKAVFDLDYILIAGSARNSATEGQDATIASVWDDEYAMVARIATSNDIREPCLGRVFHWGEDGSAIGGMVESYRDETVRSDIIRCRHDVDELILYTEVAQLLDNVTS